jgi:ketosteroid isomerase-like protein
MKAILAAVSILFAAAPAFAQCSDADKKSLEAWDRGWGEATTRGDRAALQSIIADDFQGLGAAATTGKTATIDAAVATAERNRANPADAPRIVYDAYSISCTRSSATITHRNTVTARVDGKDQTFATRSVHVLEKRGGRWQAVANAGHGLDDQATLAYMERDWIDAAVKKDASWVERNYASDASDIGSTSGGIMNKAQTVADMRNTKTTYDKIDLSDLNIRVDGNTAVVTSINHFTGRDDQGKPLDRRARFTDVFIKRDGRWQVWATQGTPIK